MDGVLAELDLAAKPFKLVKCVAAHNEADWITYNLANCYDEFDIIRVVEGAVEGRPNATKDGHSTDATLELIRSFPDPAGKIELYTQNRPFKSLEEQKQVFIDVASKDEEETTWNIVCDVDEFYMEGSVERIREAIKKRPSASEFIPTFLHFYRDVRHIRDYAGEWSVWHQRILRKQRGQKYRSHPVVSDVNDKCTYFSPEYQVSRFIIPDLFIYHYGHAKSIEFHKMKQAFYKSELKKFALEDGTNASRKFDEKFAEFAEYREPLNEVLEFDGPHPHALSNHPIMQQVEPFYSDKKLRHWRQARAYSEELPTIPQWMLFERRMVAFYNTMRV